MSVSLNKIILVGRLGADAEGHETRTKGGDGFLTFSMAVDNVTKKNGEPVKLTDWFKCLIWGRERLKPYLTKGRLVLVEGAVHFKTWKDKEGVEQTTPQVDARQVLLLGEQRGHDPADHDDDTPF